MTVKNELIYTISYELHPYMPLFLLYIAFPFSLLLLHCSLSNRLTRFPPSPLSNIVLDRHSFSSIHSHLLQAVAKLRALLPTFLARIWARLDNNVLKESSGEFEYNKYMGMILFHCRFYFKLATTF